MKEHIYIGILGLTGSGKSTLAKLLLRFGFLHLEEPYAANPFLEEYYASGMKELVLQSQLFFLVRKWALTMVVEPLMELFSVSVDPDIRGDINMYAKALKRMGSLSEAEYQLYLMVAEALTRNLPTPDLLIYCQVCEKIALQRIQERGREMEKAITVEYLQFQKESLEEWLRKCRIPVLVLPFDEIDITTPAGTEMVLQEVRKILRVNRYVVDS